MNRLSRNLFFYTTLISICSASSLASAVTPGSITRPQAAAITSKAQSTNLQANDAIDANQANLMNANAAAGTSAAAVTSCTPTLLTGWYVGAMLGYGAYKVENVVSNPLFSGISTSPNTAASNWSAGATLGYGRMINRLFYLGGEIFIVANNFEQAFNVSTPINDYNNRTLNGPTYGIGILPGIKLTPETLTYIRLGYNRVTVKTKEEVVGAPINNISRGQSGFVYGIGMETLISTNYSLRGEFDHMNFGSYNTNGGYNTVVRTSNNQFFLTAIYHAG